MTLAVFLQLLANGLIVGALLAIVALGVALIFGVVRVVNFAHGEFVTLGAFTTYLVVTQLGLSPLVGIPIAFVLGAAVGAAIQVTIVAQTAGRPELDVLMVTYALSIIGLGLLSSVFGGDFRSYSEGPSGTMSFGSVVVGLRSLTVLLVCVVVGAGTILVVQRTRIGLALRALAQSRDSAAACGINVPAAELFAFALAVGLAAAAGSLVSLIGTVHPLVGHDLVLDAFVVVVLGGMGSIGGAVLAALVIGIVNAFTSFVLDDSWARILTYCLLYATLLLRPQGLLGRHVGA